MATRRHLAKVFRTVAFPNLGWLSILHEIRSRLAEPNATDSPEPSHHVRMVPVSTFASDPGLCAADGTGVPFKCNMNALPPSRPRRRRNSSDTG
jgi:hypothetical protein